jgi:hypothetical protein
MGKREKPFECILLNIALPGTCQILSGSYIKGIVLLILAGTINVKSNFNQMLFFLFNGETAQINETVVIHWLMFYPCVYFFSLWDAFKQAGRGRMRYSYLPFVFSVYSTTAGIIYSEKFHVKGLPGIVWVPVVCFLLGFLMGLAAMLLVNKRVRTA